jgi:hypothetical protein
MPARNPKKIYKGAFNKTIGGACMPFTLDDDEDDIGDGDDENGDEEDW